jgi:hypothetical protein
MLKTLALTLALGALPALLATDAGAMPLAKGLQSTASDEIILVREGCGPGMQYSNRQRRCVRDTPGAMIRDTLRDATDRCGPGRHYSRRFNRCVRN